MRRYTLWAAFLVGAAGRLGAQQPCDSVVARAFNEFDASRRLQMLIPALDPRMCPPQHAAWQVGVQLLGENLIEGGRDSLAALWLRWALRLAPEMQVDTVVFTPRLAAAYQSARGFVGRNVSAGDSLVATMWLWPAPGAEERVGHLEVASAALPASSRVVVEGGEPMVPGESRTLDPGTYGIHAWAAGYDSLWVTREVLPGVTTVVEFILRPKTAAVALPVEQPGRPPVKTPRQRIAWKWVAAGAVGVGALVAVLAGGGGTEGPTTGGIVVTLP